MAARIAILGGTFDPVHIGHLAIAEDVRFALKAERVLFVPAAQQPLKQKQHSASAADRLAMVQLAVEGNAAFAVSDFEVQRGGVSYTVETVAYISAQWPDSELFFILGTDTLSELKRWREIERLLQMCRFAIVQRPEYPLNLDLLYAALPAARDRVVTITGPRLNIAATEIRQRLRTGQPVRYHLPPAVWQYIVEHGLYDADQQPAHAVEPSHL